MIDLGKDLMWDIWGMAGHIAKGIRVDRIGVGCCERYGWWYGDGTRCCRVDAEAGVVIV
jgi:hypothetical protein